MKRNIARYLLYIYLNFIKDEENKNIFKDFALPYINFIIFVRGIYMYILSIILFPFFIVGMLIDNGKKIN
jgi:hypothetical protein